MWHKMSEHYEYCNLNYMYIATKFYTENQIIITNKDCAMYTFYLV